MGIDGYGKGIPEILQQPPGTERQMWAKNDQGPGVGPLIGWTAGGVVTGALIGSVVPGAGTAVGAGVGALIGFCIGTAHTVFDVLTRKGYEGGR